MKTYISWFRQNLDIHFGYDRNQFLPFLKGSRWFIRYRNMKAKELSDLTFIVLEELNIYLNKEYKNGKN